MGIAAVPAVVSSLAGSSVGAGVLGGAGNLFKSILGDPLEAIKKLGETLFGTPPSGQTAQANQQFGTAAGSMFANPLQTTFAPAQNGVDDDDDDDKDGINKKEVEDKMFRDLELNKIYGNNIAGR
ncbi:MAG: hypothetical protein J0H69_07410 [Burkholderiales bacterium]|nr:hypothetical protein [Burkholderiales bacterium]